jgi:hypothetical protein
MPTHARLRAVTFDCPDPGKVAEFYRAFAGWEVSHSDESFVGLVSQDGLWIGFQRVEGYRAPEWPGQDIPQQCHFDFGAPDLDTVEARLLELGAGKPAHQPGGDRWRVFTDPAGHPFCVSRT